MAAPAEAKPASDAVAQSIVATGLPNPTRKPRQVFVAYPYTLFDSADYRRPFKDLAKAFDIQFVFADEKITTLHILQKIADYINWQFVVPDQDQLV